MTFDFITTLPLPYLNLHCSFTTLNSKLQLVAIVIACIIAVRCYCCKSKLEIEEPIIGEQIVKSEIRTGLLLSDSEINYPFYTREELDEAVSGGLIQEPLAKSATLDQNNHSEVTRPGFHLHLDELCVPQSPEQCVQQPPEQTGTVPIELNQLIYNDVYSPEYLLKVYHYLRRKGLVSGKVILNYQTGTQFPRAVKLNQLGKPQYKYKPRKWQLPQSKYPGYRV